MLKSVVMAYHFIGPDGPTYTTSYCFVIKFLCPQFLAIIENDTYASMPCTTHMRVTMHLFSSSP